MIVRNRNGGKWIILFAMTFALAVILTCCSPYPQPVLRLI